MAAWLKANTEPDEVAFAADGSGIINYFSERPVINGDGLVNDFAYREVLDRGTQADYLRQNRVSIFIANVNRASPSEPLPKTVEMYASTYHDHPGYRFASVDSKKALADFTKDGFFGYLPFAVSDLTFDVPFYQR
jgi:hypothetical protein